MKRRSFVSRPLFWIIIAYGGLLLWSGIYRAYLTEPEIPETKHVVYLDGISGADRLDRKIRFAYKEFNREKKDIGTPVILVHGSPGDADVFDDLVKGLDDRWIIAVDLPGFGNSESNIPDYSIYAHSKYLAEFAAKLEIEEAHFVGFSLGGGVILHLADESPDLVKSVSFISSIGVQEYELFGNFFANRIVHAFQLGCFWLLKELTPHFGIFDGMMISYARNFYDTDQRPLREILTKIDKPFQIIHGKDDPLVPVEAAREHARLVPQSEYHELDDDHFMVFIRPEKILQPLEDFWNRADDGSAVTRSTSSPTRIAESAKPFNQKILRAMGDSAFVFFLLLAILAFINEDAAFLLAGFFAAQGRFGLTFAVIACLFGALIGTVAESLLRRKICGKSKLDRSIAIPANSILSRRFMEFRFQDIWRQDDKKFWKNLFRGFLSAALWSAIVIGGAYIFTMVAGGLIFDLGSTQPFLISCLALLVVVTGYRIIKLRGNSKAQ